jgi:hypothetical protein
MVLVRGMDDSDLFGPTIEANNPEASPKILAWLALEQARRLAEAGEGQSVLLLCYNLALHQLLEKFYQKTQPAKGHIVVHSWESLAREIFDSAGLNWNQEIPETPELLQEYYDITAPSTLHDIVNSSDFQPKYDALVVDEAQDHTTHLEGEANRAGTNWWAAYWKLLKQGNKSSVAIFYDAAQRPAFRHGNFSADRLAQSLAKAVRIRLPHTVRYTRQIFNYLKHDLMAPATTALIAGLEAKPPIIAGPEVIHKKAAPEDTAATIQQIITQWIEEGWCREEDILILSPHRDQEGTSLKGIKKIGALKLVDGHHQEPDALHLLSINRAKGLDEAAVIVIDLPPFNPKGETQDQYNHFMAASRARQLLAIVERVD